MFFAHPEKLWSLTSEIWLTFKKVTSMTPPKPQKIMGVNEINFFSIFNFEGVTGHFNQKKVKNLSTAVFTLFSVKLACNSLKIEDRGKFYFIDHHYFLWF